MSSPFDRPPRSFTSMRAEKATFGLVAALLAVSVAAAYLQRSTGHGARELIFSRDAVLHGELWRLCTYPFVKIDSPFSLLFGCLVLWMFGNAFEGIWGTKAFLRFFALSSIGAAALAVPLGLLFDASGLFVDRGLFGGPDAAIDAMMVALAVMYPSSHVLFGFVLPIEARTLVLVILGLEVLGGIMTGVASLGLTLGGMISGYLLVTGTWRPTLLWAKLRLWWINRRRRRQLYVVPPKRRRPFS